MSSSQKDIGNLFVQHDSINYPQIIKALKLNYQERVNAMQQMFGDACFQLENDQILDQLKSDKTLEEFRRQRINQIVSECFLYEQEIYLNKLIETNALLQSEVQRIQMQRNYQANNYQDQNKNLAENKMQLQRKLQEVAQWNSQLKGELKKFEQQRAIDLNNFQFAIQTSQEGFINNIEILKQELSACDIALEDQKNAKQKMMGEIINLNRALDNQSKESEVLSKELGICQEKLVNFEKDKQETDKLLKNQQSVILKKQNELRNLREQMFSIQSQVHRKEELNDLKYQNFNQIQRQLDDALRIKRILQTEISEQTQKIQAVQLKKKEKVENLNKKIQDLQSQVQEISLENANLKHRLQENLANFDNMVQSFQTDMKFIKSEWERKCQEIQINKDQHLLEMKAKHQITINNLQVEYQSLIDRKVKQLEQGNIVSLINTNTQKHAEKEKNPFIQRELITKTEHKSILDSEIELSKSQFNEKLRQMEQRHQREISLKIREITERQNSELDILTEGLKKNLLNAELQLDQKKSDIRNLHDKLSNEIDQFSQIQRELLQSNERNQLINSQNDELKAFLQEKNSQISQLQNTVDEQLQKLNFIDNQLACEKEKSGRVSEVIQKDMQSAMIEIQQADVYSRDLLQQIDMKENDIKQLKQACESFQRQVENLTKGNNLLKEEVAGLLYRLQGKTNSRDEKLDLLKVDFNIRLQNEMIEHQKTKTQLDISEEKRKNESEQLEQRISTLQMAVQQYEQSMYDGHVKIMGLESSLTRSEQTKRDLENQLKKNTLNFKTQFIRCIKNLQYQTDYLQNDLKGLQSTCLNQFQHFSKAQGDLSNEVLVKFGQSFQDNIGFMKQQINTQYERKIEVLEQEIQEWQNRAKGENQNEITGLKQTIRHLKQENDNLIRDSRQRDLIMDQLNDHINKLQVIVKEKDQEIEELTGRIQNCQQEIVNVHEMSKNEIQRIKEQANNFLTSLPSQDSQMKQELLELQENLHQIKAQHQNQMVVIESDVTKLLAENENEISLIRIEYENQIRNIEGTLREKDRELSEKEELMQSKIRQIFNKEIELKKKYQVIQNLTYELREVKQLNDTLSQSSNISKIGISNQNTNRNATFYDKDLREPSSSNATNSNNQSANQQIDKLQAIKEKSQQQIEQLKVELLRAKLEVKSQNEIIEDMIQKSKRESHQSLASVNSNPELHQFASPFAGTSLRTTSNNFFSNVPPSTQFNSSNTTTFVNQSTNSDKIYQPPTQMSIRDIKPQEKTYNNQLIRRSEKDLQELQNIIAKSYETLNSSLDKSIKSTTQSHQNLNSEKLKTENIGQNASQNYTNLISQMRNPNQTSFSGILEERSLNRNKLVDEYFTGGGKSKNEQNWPNQNKC